MDTRPPKNDHTPRRHHGRLHRSVALVLSWVFTASTAWAGAPPPVLGGDGGDGRRGGPWPSAVPGLAAALRESPPNSGAKTAKKDDGERSSSPAKTTSTSKRGRRPPQAREPIVPRAECVEERHDGRWIAHFGYDNANRDPVVVSYGEDNRFSPARGRRGQPVKFLPGPSRLWPRSSFRVRFDGEPLTWFLRGPDGVLRSATVSKTSPRCGVPQSPPSQIQAQAQSEPQCETLFWGPKRFTRTSGSPNVYTEMVSVPGWVIAPHVLQVINGTPDGRQRVSSARITIDGVEVASPSDFSQKVAGFARAVDLGPESELVVRLTSAPGSFLRLSICGTNGDHTAPVLAWTEPTDGAATNDPTPRLALVYEDLLGAGEPGAAGVDPDTLVVTLDGVDRTTLFTKRSGDATADLPDDP